MQKRGRPPHPEVLTPREFEVLALLRERLTNEQIADRLGVTAATAKYHVSEIITKLGVASRHEAALWQPEPDSPATGPPRRAWALAFPAALLRRAHALTPIAGGGIILAAAAAVALLAWGVVSARSDGTGGGETSQRSPARRCEPPAAKPGSISTNVEPPKGIRLVDVRAGRCETLPIGDRVMLAQWVEDGKTIVAYDIDRHAYAVFDLSGTESQFIYFPSATASDPIPATVTVSPDGSRLLIERAALHTLTMRDVLTQRESDLPVLDGINTGASFSPDGRHIAYVNVNGGTRSLVLAASDATGPTMLRSVSDSQQHLTPLQWSPDGAYLLVLSGQLGSSCGPDCRNFGTFGTEVIDTTGASVWKSPILSADQNDYRVTMTQWAGARRLLISQPDVNAKDGSDLPATARFVSIPDAVETAADRSLALASTVSPNGKYVAVGCDLVDIGTLEAIPTDGCGAVTSWTADSSFGLSSFGGN